MGGPCWKFRMGQQFGCCQRLVIVREKKRRQTTRYWWGKGGPGNRTNEDAFLIFSVYYLDSILFYFQHQSEVWRNRCQQPNQVGENVQQGGTIDQLHLVISFFRLNALLIFRNWDRSYWTNSATIVEHSKRLSGRITRLTNTAEKNTWVYLEQNGSLPALLYRVMSNDHNYKQHNICIFVYLYLMPFINCIFQLYLKSAARPKRMVTVCESSPSSPLWRVPTTSLLISIWNWSSIIIVIVITIIINNIHHHSQHHHHHHHLPCGESRLPH